MHYDHISFHLDNFPKNLPPQHAVHHIGYYFSWAVSQNLHSDAVAALPNFLLLKNNNISGTTFILSELGGGIDETCFNDLGNQFTQFYYDDDEDGYGHFLNDYFLTLDIRTQEEFYNINDNLEIQNKLNITFQNAFDRWKQSLIFNITEFM